MKKLLLLIPIVIIILIIIYICLPTKVAVITYHDFVKDSPSNNMQINIDEFEKEMKFLKDNNFNTLEMKDIECFINKTCKLPKKSILITIDDGWKNTLSLAIPIIEKYNLKATIFYIGTAYENPNFLTLDDIKDIKDNHKNIEIASHTYDLHYDKAYLNDFDTLDSDFKKMRKFIDTKYFAYPYGLKSDNYVKALKENNYSLAFTFGPNKEHRKLKQSDDRYALPRLNYSTNTSLFKFKLRLLLPF